MANTSTSYSQWMQDNPELVGQVQQRYAQPQPTPAPQPVAPVQPAPVVQARDTEAVPMMQQPKPVASTQSPSTGAPGGGATQQSQQGMDGAKNIASTIASFYTGGATSAIGGVATGGSKGGNDPTHDQANAKKDDGGMDAGGIFSIVSKFMGGGGK